MIISHTFGEICCSIKKSKKSVDSELISHINVSLCQFKGFDNYSESTIHFVQAQLIKIAYSVLKSLTGTPVEKIPQSLLTVPTQLLIREEYSINMLTEVINIEDDLKLPSVALKMQKYLNISVAYRDIIVMYFTLTAKCLASLNSQFRSSSVPILQHNNESRTSSEKESKEIVFDVDESSTDSSTEETIKRIDSILSPSPSPRVSRNSSPKTKQHKILSTKNSFSDLLLVFKKKKQPKAIELHKLQAFGKFGTTILVISLLRNYELRDKILEAICKVNDIEFIEEQKNENLIKQYPLIFGWDSFNDVVDSYQKYNYQKLLEIGNDWELSLRHYTRFFKEFFYTYIHTLDDIVQDEKVFWDTFPGFKIITNAYFLTFSEDYVTVRENFLNQTESKLLTASHPNMLNKFMTISASKTNLYDIDEVIELFKFYELMFVHLKSKGFLIGNGFDLEKFISVIDRVIETQSNKMISKMLCFLYEVVDCFCGETRKNLFDVIIKKWFFTLSLYWEDRVRGLFLQLIVNKSCLVKRSHIKNLSDDDKAIYNQHVTYGKTDPIVIDERIIHRVEKKLAQMKSSVKKESKHIPSRLQIYSKHTVSMLIYFQQQYNEWEKSESNTPLSLVIVEMRQEKDEFDVLYN